MIGARVAGLLLLAGIFLYVDAKVYSRCGLVQELVFQEFNNISDWVCLIEAANAGRDSQAITKVDGKNRYGLFQIDSDWCSEHFWPGKKCFVKCRSMVKGTLKKSSKCALKIFAEKGFEGFPEWKENCEGKQLPDIEPCLK